jgi:nitrite reductase/ring-hydroxylating ferredoxin subunit
VKLFDLAQLTPRGSVRFPLDARREGFAVLTSDGAVRAYVNICSHRAEPVDIGDGRLWLPTGEIECQAHGARFDPVTGACTGGPCAGRGLTPLQIEVRDGAVFLE